MGGVNLPSDCQILSTFALNSGFRLTLPAALYFDGLSRRPVPVYRERYGAKSPVYHWLEVFFRCHVVRDTGKFRTFTVGVNNVYGRWNTTYLINERDVSNYPDTPNTTQHPFPRR